MWMSDQVALRIGNDNANLPLDLAHLPDDPDPPSPS